MLGRLKFTIPSLHIYLPKKTNSEMMGLYIDTKMSPQLKSFVFFIVTSIVYDKTPVLKLKRNNEALQRFHECHVLKASPFLCSYFLSFFLLFFSSFQKRQTGLRPADVVVAGVAAVAADAVGVAAEDEDAAPPPPPGPLLQNPATTTDTHRAHRQPNRPRLAVAAENGVPPSGC